jgi:uncharacterized protein (TIGR02145 family)
MKLVTAYKIELLILLMIIVLSLTSKSQTVSDFDGNVYPFVTIGDQIWMAENLKVTHYSDGVPLEYTDGLFEIDDTLKRFFYYNDDSTNAEQYGCLYNWYASIRGTVGDSSNPSAIQGVCPENWHLPSKAEWEELIAFLGEGAADQLKPEGWTGFNAQFGGIGGDNTPFQGIDIEGNYITADPDIYNLGYPGDMISFPVIIANQSEVLCYYLHPNTSGYSVRCVKDTSSIMDSPSKKRNLNRINFYPNPSNGYILFKSDFTNIELKINLYSLDGKLLLTKYLYPNYETFQLTEIKKGVYFIKISGEDIYVLDKLIIN